MSFKAPVMFINHGVKGFPGGGQLSQGSVIILKELIV